MTQTTRNAIVVLLGPAIVLLAWLLGIISFAPGSILEALKP